MEIVIMEFLEITKQLKLQLIKEIDRNIDLFNTRRYRYD